MRKIYITRGKKKMKLQKKYTLVKQTPKKIKKSKLTQMNFLGHFCN